MMLKNVVDFSNKSRARKERVKAAQQFATKAVNKIEDIKDSARNVAEDVVHSAALAAQDVANAIHDVDGKKQ